MGEINFYKGSVKVVFNRSALNPPTSALNKKKLKKERKRVGKLNLSDHLLLHVVPLYVSCERFHLDLVLRQFRFSLRTRVFKMSSRFFLRDYVKAVFCYFVSLWSFLSLCLDSLHVFYSFTGFRFCQRSKYKHVRHCDCNFDQIVQFSIIILCKYPKVNMHILHTVLDIFPMDLTRRIC